MFSKVSACFAACSRKTLICLILTLNHVYPDYDFTLLRAQHFQKEEGSARAEECIDSHLLEVSRVRIAHAHGAELLCVPRLPCVC